MVKLKRLKIERYRNVKPGTELHFRDSFNVLLGKNGTGKTTLLELIARLLSWDFSQFQHEPCDIEYEVVESQSRVVVRLRVEQTPREQNPAERFLPHRHMGLEDMAGQLPETGSLTASLDVTAEDLVTGARYLLRVAGSNISLGTEKTDPFHEERFEYPLLVKGVLSNISRSLSKFEQTLEQRASTDGSFIVPFIGIQALKRFDESLGFFEHIPEILSTAFFYEQGVVYPASLEFPHELASNLEDVLDKHRDTDELSFDSKGDSSGFLQRIIALLDFESAQFRLRCIKRDTKPVRMARFGDAWFSFQRKDGSTTNHTLLSYGQKRLLAFYYYLACNPYIVVADELVNGMHHEWIEACFEDMGERQAFLTSQNPLLLDYLWFESAEEVRSSFVLCRAELNEGREQLVWENMSEQEAEGFFSAYQVKIQHVGELLRTRRLW
jgi:energy-coupling factor transporter ATP-binding protein EcfA2